MRSSHVTDTDGNPTGGVTRGRGLKIDWQNGPLGRPPNRKEPNGAFVEDVIKAAVDRLEYYQQSKFACEENAKALEYLHMALNNLATRTTKREAREVEGTYEV